MTRMSRSEMRKKMKEAMKKLDKVYIASDMDRPGLKVQEIAKIDLIISKCVKRLK